MRSSAPPDSVSGHVRADDPDGLDSVWVSLDSITKGEDGGFEQVFSSRFLFVIPTGRAPGSRIPLSVRARDLAGFEVSRDTQIVVVP